MFKLTIMYALMFQPGYPLTLVHLVGGFRTMQDCETFAKSAGEAIATNKAFVKGQGFYECERDK